MYRFRLFQILLFFLFLPQFLHAQTLIENGDFSKWKNGLPVGWTSDTGAQSGNASVKSTISKGKDGSLWLSGDSKTNNWQFVSQSIDVKSGENYVASFEAKAINVRRESGQRDNCYVGVLLKDKSGRVIKFDVSSVDAKTTTKYQRQVNIPRTATKAVVAIFLSKSGTLSVNSADLKKVYPKDSFQVLVDDMGRNYSYFQHKKIDWEKLTSKFEKKANDVAEDPQKFSKVILEMLGEMKDSHIWIYLNGKQMSSYSKGWEPNYDFRVVSRSLESVKRIGILGLVGKTTDGFGYVRVDSLFNIPREQLNDMVGSIQKLYSTKGMIIDIRRNRGGSENNAQVIASLFASEKVVYAKQSRRSGPGHSDLKVSGERLIAPSRKDNYRKPIVCLIGPGAVSSGEGMAMMFKAIKQCTIVGTPTRGASGNPMPVVLPNGVEVWYSRWVAMLPDGTVIEDKGIEPDVRVNHAKGSDNTFQEAIKILKAKTR